MPEENRPPRRIWGDGEALSKWLNPAEDYNPNDGVVIEGPTERNAAADLLISG